MNCTQCGTALSPGSSFCATCGARQLQVGVPAPGLASFNAGGPLVDGRSGLPYSHRSKMAAGLLQIFLGGFGAGRFYTGHTGIAIAQIAVTWLTCGLGALWPLIDGIMMLTGSVPDVDGRPMRD
ncbi:MAG: TM2 domain-containing protein [Myxococcaceae bacterium]